jgi:membrane-associated phospholipid phosphatase
LIVTRRTLAFGLGAGVLIAVVSLCDPWAFAHLRLPGIYDHNWGRLLRVVGWLPLWLLVGIAAYRSSATFPGRRHALLLMLAPTLSGALGEILKLLVRRERPAAHAGAYVFRSFSDRPFYSGAFGMPSGDAIVAFAACTIAARLWPRARWIWYGLAAGCALARVASQAHFLSDVTVAALVGWAVASLVWRRYSRPASFSAPSTAT